jgi:hypothetical protein
VGSKHAKAENTNPKNWRAEKYLQTITLVIIIALLAANRNTELRLRKNGPNGAQLEHCGRQPLTCKCEAHG